jgi:HK97 family phage major capsid protein
MTKQLGKLYDEKKSLMDKMDSILSSVQSRSDGKATVEEKRTFDEVEAQLKVINDSIELHKVAEKKGLAEEARNAMRVESENGEGNENNFRSASGKELPVFNRSNKTSVREWYEKENKADESLRGMTFGRIAKAYLLGATSELEERALAEGTDSTGGFTVPEIVSASFIDRMRPKSRVLQAGANLFTVDQRTDKFSWAKLTTGITAEWKAENASQSSADPAFGNVQFSFKTLRALVVSSNELIQDSLNFEKILEAEAAGAFAAEFDRVALVGSSGAGQPVGIANYTNAVKVSMPTNGAEPSNYNEIIALIAELQTENAEVDGMTPAIMHPRTLASYNVLLSAVDDQPIQRPNYIASMPFLQTTSVPVNDSYGSSNVASKLFLGDWSKLYFGMRLGVTILPLRERYADYNQTGFLIAARIDVQPTHENAFGFIQGLLGTTLPT